MHYQYSKKVDDNVTIQHLRRHNTKFSSTHQTSCIILVLYLQPITAEALIMNINYYTIFSQKA